MIDTVEIVKYPEINPESSRVVRPGKALYGFNCSRGFLFGAGIMKKICSKCNTVKSIGEFYKRNESSDGFYYQCKQCQNIYANQYKEVHKDRLKIHAKAYYQNHRAEKRVKEKQYYQIHKHRKNLYDKQYRQENAISISVQRKKHYSVNKEELRKISNQYQKTERGRIFHRRASHKRRALQLNSSYENFTHEYIFERDDYRCQKCKKKTRPDYTQHHPLFPNLDHIVPLSLGGPHTKLNTQCLCHQCNMKKNNTGILDQLRMFE